MKLDKFLKMAVPVVALATCAGMMSGCNGYLNVNGEKGVPLGEHDLAGKAPKKLLLMGADTVRVTAGDALKIELVVPVFGDDSPTAVASSNCHRDHFGLAFGIETADGSVAHSACAAFGVERIALALLHTHGLDPALWPASVRERLWG